METVDERVRDILRVKFLIGLFDRPYQTDFAAADEEVNGAEHNVTALRASLECLVLLKNNGILPLERTSLKKVAVLGPNANEDGYAHIHYGPKATESVTVYEGLRKALEGQAEVVYAKGCPHVDAKWPDSELYGYEPTEEELAGIAEAVALAQDSDVAVVVVGGDARTCGENKSRSSLDLPGCQDLLLKEVAKAGKPLVVVLVNGRPLSVNWADKHAAAILEAWYPGAHGGTAVAMALLGDYNPGGKLSVTFPKTVGQIPLNFPFKPNSQVDGGTGLGPKGRKTRAAGALYDFGYGLSYTTFRYDNLRLSADRMMPGDSLTLTFDVTNTGARKGDEIVQVYLHDRESSITVYDKMLRGFERVRDIAPGETRTVRITLPAEAFRMLDRNMKEVIEPGLFDVYVGASSVDFRLSATVTMCDPARPERTFKEDDPAGELLPAVLRKGDTVTFPLDGNIPFNRFEATWLMDVDCSFEVLVNEGGGFFTPVWSGKGTAQPKRVTLSGGARQGSDLRIRVTEGHGTLSGFTCEALKRAGNE